jgi:hypothetical protein
MMVKLVSQTTPEDCQSAKPVCFNCEFNLQQYTKFVKIQH